MQCADSGAYLHRRVLHKSLLQFLLTQVEAKAPAKKKTTAAKGSAQVAASAAAEGGDSDEESIEQELTNVDWEVRCALLC